eukprot:366053_1
MGCCVSENKNQIATQEPPDENINMESDNDLDDKYTITNEDINTFPITNEDISNDNIVTDAIIEETSNNSWKHRKFHSTIYDNHLINFMESQDNNYLVIDVRDPSLDYPGGHIKTSINIFHEEFINKVPFIINKYNNISNIIFHCMYSQSRGPMCCKWYCLAVECLLKNYNKNNNEKSFQQCIEESKDFEILKSIDLDQKMYNNLVNQNIMLLKGGFRDWVNKYKDNGEYVEDFTMEYWQYEVVGGKRELYHKNDW